MTNKDSLSEFEKRLQLLSIAEPSEDYYRKNMELIRKLERTTSRESHGISWRWGLAVALMLSVSTNVWFLNQRFVESELSSKSEVFAQTKKNYAINAQNPEPQLSTYYGMRAPGMLKTNSVTLMEIINE
ncbi:hypothetical protein [Aliikangiella sp. G2MR2-5]|uniref:hypothetical protein n=1 Tax=Aliikangiella sp. G2MR2-5 TaxID=2788943 RepID=UPI0018AB5E62|nr:hypothetical protein [Aliikangiella sp. G2MR2-5]